jgi:hypothetical protein
MRVIGRGVVPLVLVAVLVLPLGGCRDSLSQEDKTRAIAAANSAYVKAKLDGVDLANGPCLVEQLSNMPEWSVDIAHNPRQSVDNQAANQCQFYRQGKTKHFVELDPDGNVIRVK